MAGLRLTGCALVLGLLLPGGRTDAAAPTASIDYKLPKSTTLGEPAVLTVQLRNTTGYRIVVDFGVSDQTAFVFRHTRPDGTVERVTPALTPVSRMRTSRLMLRGTSYTALVVLDEWLSLAQPGRHLIDVEFHGAVTIDGGNQAELKRRATLAIDVTPRDAKRLEKRAGEWLKKISTLAPGAESRAAAVALIAMTDPVAIPYLELATSRTRSPAFAEALHAMAHPGGREALERLARSPDADVRAIALKALAGR